MQCLRLESIRSGGALFDFQSWDDSEIDMGESWKDKILTAIDEAKIAVLLISPDFLTSKFILDEEVPRMLKLRDEGKLVITPVIVRPSPWESVGWLNEIQLFPANGDALSGKSQHDIEDDLTRFCIEVNRLACTSEAVSDGVAEPLEGVLPASKRSDTTHRFLGLDGVRDLVQQRHGVDVVDAVQLHDVQGSQQVWLAASRSTIFCIIDDAKTAATRRYIQWTLPLVPRPNVSAKGISRTKTAGRVNIGKRQNWLYSKKLYETPTDIENAINALIDTATQQ